MKLKPFMLLATLVLTLLANVSYAAFPVKNEAPPAAMQELAANNLKDGIIIDNYTTGAEMNAPAAPAPYGQQRRDNGTLGIISLACGVVGTVAFGIPLGIAAAITGAIGMAPHRSLKGLAIAGLILGILDVVFVLLIVAAM